MLISEGLPYTWQVFFLMMLPRFSICLWLSAFFLWCFWMLTSLKLLFGVYWPCWMCRLLFFRKFQTFSAIISWNIFSSSFPFTYISGTPITYMLVGTLRSVLHFSEILLIFLHFSLSLLFRVHNLFLSILKLLILSSANSYIILSLCSKFLILVIVLSNPRIPFYWK